MGRRNNVCSEKHTSISPRKNCIRRDMLKKVRRSLDAITISHGALDVFMILGWKGRVQTCDIDPGVRLAIEYLRKGDNGRKGDYPDLNLPTPGKSIQETVSQYCAAHGAEHLGIVDVDLAVGILPSWKILSSVLDTLVQHKYHGRTFLTFRNGRDGFGKNSLKDRIDWLRKQLPQGIKVSSFTPYQSVRLDPNALRSIGSNMCIVELKHSK